MPDLKEKVVVVTGAAGRLGQVLVPRFAEEGARVVAVVHRAEAAGLLPFSPEQAEERVYVADLTDEAAAKQCFEAIVEKNGRLDVLVHAVGMWESRPLAQISFQDWQRVLDVNLTSAVLCFREAARAMQRGGRLIGFASRQGVQQGQPGQSAYAAAKAGLMRLVESAAGEYRADGITVHAIAPSLILYGAESGDGVRAEALADLCLHLCGPAGDALNGATIPAYGSG